jgi:hypothetical protein
LEIIENYSNEYPTGKFGLYVRSRIKEFDKICIMIKTTPMEMAIIDVNFCDNANGINISGDML